MERTSTSYCVYTPGNISPSRPPMRRAAPEHARSGFPFLIGMAALVLAVGVGSVARFCPQDLRFESGGKHPAKSTPTTAAITADAKPLSPTSAAPVITPTAFTTIGAPSEPAAGPAVVTVAAPPPSSTATTTSKKRTAHAPRSGARAPTAPSASASATASGAPALPENPYPQASEPGAYGF